MAFDPTTARLDADTQPPARARFDPDSARIDDTPRKKTGALRSAGDSAIALGTGLAQGVQMLTNVAGADNAVSQGIGDAIGTMRSWESPERQAERAARAEKIKQAEESGSTWEEVKAYARSFAEAPLDTTLEALGTAAPTIAGAALTGGTSTAAQIAARAAPLALGAAQGVGAVKGEIHESVENRWKDAGASDEEAAARAAEAQSYAGENAGNIALGGALGVLGGSTGVESAVRRLAGSSLAREAAERGAPGVVRGALTGALKEAPMEALQGGHERYAANVAGQREGFDVPTWQGVAGQATLEGMASAPLGGGFGAANAYAAGRQRQDGADGQDAAGARGGDGSPTASPFDQAVPPPVLDADALERAGISQTPGAILDEQQLQRWGVDRLAPAADLPQIKPSEQMGLDPATGTMSAAAAMAVDSGVSAQSQQVAQEVTPEVDEVLQQGATASEPTSGIADQLEAAQGPDQVRDILRRAEADDVVQALAGRPDLDQVARSGLSDGAWNLLRDELSAARNQLDAASQLPGQTTSPVAPAGEQRGAPGVAQAQVTREAVDTVKQQTAEAIGQRLQGMKAGEVNTFAARFLPTMGLKPTASKARNIALLTDGARVNLYGVAGELGVELSDASRSALEADMAGTVAEPKAEGGQQATNADTQAQANAVAGSAAAEPAGGQGGGRAAVVAPEDASATQSESAGIEAARRAAASLALDDFAAESARREREWIARERVRMQDIAAGDQTAQAALPERQRMAPAEAQARLQELDAAEASVDERFSPDALRQTYELLRGDQMPVKNESRANADDSTAVGGADQETAAQPAADERIAAPDGSIDFGEITPEMAQASPQDGTRLDRAMSILLDRTDNNGSPDGLGGPKNADARTAIVSALTGQSVADIEAAPNYKFVTSVPQVERLLYDAAGIPADNLAARRAPFLDWVDARTGQPAPAPAAMVSLPEAPDRSAQGAANEKGAVPSEAEIAAAARQFRETEAAYGGREAFERAKAAGKTRLNYHQWVQVRTPNFKRWFGDWEAIADLTISRQVASKKEAELSIAALAKRDLRNLETGINAQINSTQAKKLISNAAVDKSIANGFTREQHYAIAANIEALWRHAVQVYEGPDAQNDDPKVRIKRFAVPVMIGSDARYATIMAKETIEHGHRVYTLEAHGEKTLRGMLDTLNSETGISSTPARSVDSIVASLDSKVNPDTVSKVTDPETGEPMVVYHGTLADFNAFDRGAESNFRYGEAENSGGIFFGTSPESVEYYLEGRRGFERGANILPAFVSIRNPASIDDAPRSLAEQARLLHDAEAAGHDGALIGDQVIAFAPGQAKSATGNQGTFDGSNPDIRFSFAGRTAQTADQYALAAAQRRIAMGENAETVRQDTGWHRGDDGKWRFEISDDQARVAVGGANAAEIYDAALLDGEVVRVADVLDHPQLFAAYPHLADVRVELLPAVIRAQARYQHSEHTGAGLLQINPRVKREAMVKTLLHELQHGIQFREGFAQGGSPEAFASDSQEQGADAYRRLAGEVESRNVEARRQMTPEQRRAIAPAYTSDTMPGDVLVTFNGKRIVTPPHNATSRMPMTESGLMRAMRRQFPGLAGNVEKMLGRGLQGKKGGLVMIDSADPLQIARVFAEKTGRSMDESIKLFSEDGVINGIYDPRTGLTFLVGPNLDPVTAPAVLLHESVHGQQRKKIDAQAMDMLMNRAQEKDENTRAFLDRAAQRMTKAGAATDSKEAAPYIVEQAVIEGRSAGYKMADSKFFAWADSAFGKRVGDFLRSVAAMVRTWMIRHGGIKTLTIDDLVGYAMAGVKRAADGAVTTKGGSAASVRPDSLTGAIRAVIDAARNPGHAPQKAKLGSVADWLAEEARARAGLNIAGFTHVLDGSAVRHMLNRHTNPTIEKNRGQIPLTDADIAAAAEVIATPDQVVLGTKTQGHKDQIAYLKRQDDGSILYLEEVRTGRRELAAVSMRKYPAAKDFSDIVATLPSNARSDGGDGLIVVSPPGGGNIGGSLQSMTVQDVKRPGESGVGNVTTRPTSSAPTTTQRGDGAGPGSSLVAQSPEGNDGIRFSRSASQRIIDAGDAAVAKARASGTARPWMRFQPRRTANWPHRCGRSARSLLDKHPELLQEQRNRKEGYESRITGSRQHGANWRSWMRPRQQKHPALTFQGFDLPAALARARCSIALRLTSCSAFISCSKSRSIMISRSIMMGIEHGASLAAAQFASTMFRSSGRANSATSGRFNA